MTIERVSITDQIYQNTLEVSLHGNEISFGNFDVVSNSSWVLFRDKDEIRKVRDFLNKFLGE
jgi:hypothetical protein